MTDKLMYTFITNEYIHQEFNTGKQSVKVQCSIYKHTRKASPPEYLKCKGSFHSPPARQQDSVKTLYMTGPHCSKMCKWSKFVNG